MTDTLRGFLNDIKKIIDKNPEALDYPIYTVCSSSGVLSDDVLVFESEVLELDLDASPLDKDDIGKPYICFSYD